MVAEKLKEGKENAIRSKDLAGMCGFNSTRELQSAIAREREAGAVILSTSTGEGGYYLPETRSEVEEFTRTLEHRAKNTFRALKSAREYLKQIDGQESFSDFKEGEGR